MVDLNKLLNIKENHMLDLTKLIRKYFLNNKRRERISSGTKNIDYVLGGGLCSGEIYLIFGPSTSGKTQFCHQMCVQSIISKRIVYYLDTENTFRAERVSELAKTRKIDPKTILKDIFVSKIMSSSTLLHSLNKIEENLNKKASNILIIDTINKYFRYDQGDQSSSFHKTRINFLNILKKLSAITKKFNLITIATAQILPNFLDSTFIKDIPVGNQYLNHYISEYIYLQLEDEKTNSIHLVNSHNLPEKKRYYKITPAGIEDFNY